VVWQMGGITRRQVGRIAARVLAGRRPAGREADRLAVFQDVRR
jgi:hypothetical protein